VCNENDKSTGRHFVVTDEDRRKGQAEFVIAADVLATYAGPYNLKIEGKSIPSSVVLENGRLFVVPPVGGKFPIFAESETTFTVSAGAPLIFHKDARGAVTGFVIHTVEGLQEFERKREK
jgi:hypothetical protein